MILPRPLITRHPSGSWHQDIAFTWRSPSQVPLPSGMGFSRGELPAVRMSGNTTAARPSRDFSQAARAQRVALPPMLLDVIWSLPLHPGTPGQAHDDYDHLAAALRQLNTAYWLDEARNREAGDLGQAAGEHASGAIVDEDPDGTLGSRFLYAFWRLCEQQIGAVQAAPARHSAQVTGTRAGLNPDVRVVALRRAGSSGRPAAQTDPHQWHHHWVVRMHKVRQWYPSLQQHKVIYRGPFVKGDMAKPLLAGAATVEVEPGAPARPGGLPGKLHTSQYQLESTLGPTLLIPAQFQALPGNGHSLVGGRPWRRRAGSGFGPG